jgi:hypothetical protein
MRARLRKVTRNRGQFPSEQAALKVLYLAVRNLQDYRSPEYRDPQLGGGNKPSRRSRFTSKDESRPHDRHDHLHRRSDAPRSDAPLASGGRMAGIVGPYLNLVPLAVEGSWSSR